MNLAPIVLFVYNRPKHTRQTIEALLDNPLAPQSHLYIYSDGAKDHDTKEQVQAVRDYLHELRTTHDLSAQSKQANTETQSTAARHQGTHTTAPHALESRAAESHTQTSPTTPRGFASITIIERKRNFGLAESIIDGVTTIIKKHGKIIVLEDDIVTSPTFLTYMNRALEHYASQPKVWNISAWNYPMNPDLFPEDTFFWRIPHCWGWATWQDRWEHYKRDIPWVSKNFNQKDIDYININKTADYWEHFVANQKGKIKTWAIFWYLMAYKNQALTLMPKIPLIKQIGFDGSGVHCDNQDPFQNPLFNTSEIKTYPSTIQENERALQAIMNFHRKHAKLTHRITKKLKSLLKKLLK